MEEKFWSILLSLAPALVLAAAPDRGVFPPTGVRVPPEARLRQELAPYLQLKCSLAAHAPNSSYLTLEYYDGPKGRKALVTRTEPSQGFPTLGKTSVLDVTEHSVSPQNIEMVSATGLEWTVDRNAKLSPQRYSGMVRFEADGKPAVTGNLECQSYDRLPVGKGKEMEARCDQQGKPLGSGYRVFFYTSLEGGARVAEIQNMFGYQTERSVRIERGDENSHRTYRGDGLQVDIDLSHPIERETYGATATINVRTQKFGEPVKYVDEAGTYHCSTFDYLPPGTKALSGFMTGRGPAVDPQGVKNLKATLQGFEQKGLIRLSGFGAGGIEGGISFCLELAPGVDPAALQQVFTAIRAVPYNHYTTSLNLDPVAGCSR